VRYTRVTHAAYIQLVGLPMFQVRHFQVFFGYDCGVNIGCRPYVLQTVLVTEMYSVFWLSQNVLYYNSVK
jgi:hypothetical protein